MGSNNQIQKKKERLNNYARFSGVGFQMLATIGVGVWGGIKLDNIYPNNYQVFTVICSLISIGVALYLVIKQVTKFSNQKNNTND
ncbi:MAG: AtpZ/AtpI family protein [Flavobacteriaceae bacterium]|nr:AtpZ/AtpI family protein [Flavobacteriaceae bacterium]MDG1380422.1 AtpZ/AtpI family protein [Flavobacteriaceae bacterium]MDG2351004.1 AtpZ/AtpI family protein [Flavobacteriaceae bacterium]